LKGAQTRKKQQTIIRGTLAKPGCYSPKQDEVLNLKNFATIYKQVKSGGTGGGFNQAIGSVIDAECLSRDFSSGGLVAPSDFIESMGMTKNRAQGKFHHQCYLRYNTVKGTALKTNFTKAGEKKNGKPRKPKIVPLIAPANFGPVEQAPPPPQTGSSVTTGGENAHTYGFREQRANSQSALGPM